MTESPLTCPTCFAVGLDADRLAADLLLQAAIDAVAAADLRVDRRLHLGLADHLLAGIGGELVGFPQQIDKGRARSSSACRHSPASRAACSMTRATAAAVERPQLLAPGHRADQPRIEQRRFRRALDPVLEIGGDLEQIGEFLVLGAEQVIERRRTDQHHLDLERDRLRRSDTVLAMLSSCSSVSIRIWPAFERPLQRGPAEIAGQQLLRVEHEIAAIGAVQRARGQQVEIGDERAEAGEVLDPADQRLMRRVVLVDDRRAVPPAVVDDDVDLIAAEPRILDLADDRSGHRGRRFGRRGLASGNRRHSL